MCRWRPCGRPVSPSKESYEMFINKVMKEMLPTEKSFLLGSFGDYRYMHMRQFLLVMNTFETNRRYMQIVFWFKLPYLLMNFPLLGYLWYMKSTDQMSLNAGIQLIDFGFGITLLGHSFTELAICSNNVSLHIPNYCHQSQISKRT
jgi:hypothetical protein